MTLNRPANTAFLLAIADVEFQMEAGGGKKGIGLAKGKMMGTADKALLLAPSQSPKGTRYTTMAGNECRGRLELLNRAFRLRRLHEPLRGKRSSD